MAKYVDLNLLMGESLEFLGTDGEKYVIPGDISVEFMFKLQDFMQELGTIDDGLESIKKTREMVVDILNLDKSKNVDMAYVIKHFGGMKTMMNLVYLISEHMKEVMSDENLNIPKSTPQVKRKTK